MPGTILAGSGLQQIFQRLDYRLLDFIDFPGRLLLGWSCVDDGPLCRHKDRPVRPPRSREQRLDAVVIPLADRLIFVIVTARAVQSEAQDRRAYDLLVSNNAFQR